MAKPTILCRFVFKFHHMKHQIISLGIILLMLFSACSKTPKFEVEGNIDNAKGKMLYFELSGMSKTEILDSAKLTKNGSFHFKTTLPGAPEFYRLRIGERFIQLGADSASSVTIKADGKKFGKNYSVSGSKCCELIKNLSSSQSRTLACIDSLSNLYKNKQISDTVYQRKFEEVLNLHRNIAVKIIYGNPRSCTAYYALFQRIKNYLIFDPFNKNDNKYYAAVATSWNAIYPESDRSKNLVNLTLQGIKAIRQNRDTKKIVIDEKNKISFFEIELPNIYGKTVPLSSLIGKVILLDFTAYQAEKSATRNLYFRELYNKYKDRGFEIYQISLDTDENLWKTGASHLPWVCVHDRNSLRSGYLSTYNVQNLPTFFLMDKAGNIVARDAMISDLNKEIQKLL